MSGSLGSGQPVVSLSECTSEGKSSLGSHPEHVSIVVFTHAEQTRLYKPDASVVEPMRWVMQLSSLPRADPPIPPHGLWEQCLGRCKGRASFIRKEKLLLLSVDCIGEVSRVIATDPPQMPPGAPRRAPHPGSAQTTAEPARGAALLGAGAPGSPSCLLWVLACWRDACSLLISPKKAETHMI